VGATRFASEVRTVKTGDFEPYDLAVPPVKDHPGAGTFPGRSTGTLSRPGGSAHGAGDLAASTGEAT